MSVLRAAVRASALTRACAVRAIPRVSVGRISSVPPMRSFASTVCRSGQGESDDSLVASLQQEIQYEREASEAAGGADAVPEWLSQFRSEGVWQIEDQPGSDEIALTREFGNESIRVLFSIGEIDTTDPTEDLEADEADQMGSAEDEFEGSFPVRCAINITKVCGSCGRRANSQAKRGSLNIDAQAQDGQFMIENITFYRDDALATELTADADWTRRGLYIGPQFETLDENVQAQFESFLAERGIATNLALFIPTYAEYKEQREYCGWLEGVKAFVEA